MSRRFLAVLSVTAACLAVTGTAAAQGPPEEVIDAQWVCGPVESGGNLPPGHCVNPGKGGGHTFTVLVFEDGFQQETVSTNPKADSRPCIHDPEATDGTYWSPQPGLYVCHHN